MFKISGDVLLPENKNTCGRTLSHKGLVKQNEIIQNHKNTSLDSIKSFSNSYSTNWDDLSNAKTL